MRIKELEDVLVLVDAMPPHVQVMVAASLRGWLESHEEIACLHPIKEPKKKPPRQIC